MTDQLEDILEQARIYRNNVLPSVWNEQNRVVTSDISPFPGPMSYDRTPYLREIVDCLSPGHPSKIISVMKGAQIGFSFGCIEAGIGWIISQNPGNILFLTGHSDLSDEAMLKIDQMIDSTGLRDMIRPNVLRKKNSRTGDTNKSKEYPGGSLVAGSASNHKLLRQRSVRYGFIDDFDAAKSASKESGSTRKMIEQRLAAYYGKMKLYYISTPELKQTSNIEPAFLMGDQRRYHIPCPCCGEMIPLLWNVDIEGTDGKEKGGITWKLNDQGKLIRDSVGYICQKCSGFFTDKDKYDLNLEGQWIPTAEPADPTYFSYHISSLYAPPGMYDWKHYVSQYLEANPPNEPQKEDLHMTFVNLCLGETYEQQSEAPQANQLQKNIRGYGIGTIPESLSNKDGNGQIVLITCAADLNGIVEDARLDFEVVAWSETGASYSVLHGSIGTFVPREGKNGEDRERWTYEPHRPNSVWPEFDKILDNTFKTDTTGRNMRIFITGIDCGHYTQFAYNYIDSTNFYVVGLKGKDVSKFVKLGIDVPNFKPARERASLYLVEVGQIKDELADLMKLKWDERYDEHQPPGFMNYPEPAGGLYLFNNFFSHYESEHRVIETKDGQGIAAMWVKKSSLSQNHFWDVRVYNMAAKEILTATICKELKIKDYTWADYVNAVLSQ